MTALATARLREHESHDSLIVGHRLRCPRCKTVQPLLAYFAFSRPEDYADELNVVLKCRAKNRNPLTGRTESCRCIFSLGEKLDFSDQIQQAQEVLDV